MRGIISTLILVLQGFLLGSMDYSALNWEYWGNFTFNSRLYVELSIIG